MWKYNGDTVDAHKFVCSISMIQVKSVILGCTNLCDDTSIEAEEGEVKIVEEWRDIDVDKDTIRVRA
jgi:hypothetical protein